jgi:hypothetical protein
MAYSRASFLACSLIRPHRVLSTDSHRLSADGQREFTSADTAEYFEGILQGFFQDGLAGDAQAIYDIASDPVSVVKVPLETGMAIGTWISNSVGSLLGMSESEKALATAKVASQVTSELEIWKSLGEKIALGRADYSAAEVDKLNKINALAEAIAVAIQECVSELTPRDVGRFAGMIAYELVVEAGIGAAATVTAGAASALTAARLALIATKLRKLGRAGEKLADLCQPNGHLAKKLEQLFSQVKKGGKVEGGDAPVSGLYGDAKSVSQFTLAERIDLQMKHQGLIRQLQQGDVHMPSGSMSAKLMGELTTATGREVGLIRVDGRRLLRMGDADSIFMGDAQRVIGHTHPSGVLRFSGEVGGRSGDIPSFMQFQPMQKSSLLIGPDGTAVRQVIPAWFPSL